MKKILGFLRTTIAGGVLFLLPLVLLIIILGKGNQLILKISAPLAKFLPDRILGFDGSKVLAILLLLLICFVSGLIFTSGRVRKMVGSLEDNVLSNVPGYSLMKSIVAGVLGEKLEQNMVPVLVRDGDSWSIGYLVEEDKEYSVVFFPEAPKHDSGEVKLVLSSTVKKIEVSSNIVAKSLKTFGRGALQWTK